MRDDFSLTYAGTASGIARRQESNGGQVLRSRRASPASATRCLSIAQSIQNLNRHDRFMETPARPPLVLVASEHDWSSRSLESILKPSGFAVVRVATGRQAIEMAKNARPDAVILDWKLPDIGGVQVCRALTQTAEFPIATPIIVTSADAGGRAQRLEAYNAGAWLFCSQPLDVEALILQLRTFIQARREADRLREQSLVDDETGLYSFRGLTQRAREMGADAVRRQTPLACVVMAPSPEVRGDLDEVGRSPLLVEYFAEIHRKCGRLSDAVGRLGPLEFGVVAPSTTPAGAVRLAERLRAVAETTPLMLDDAPHPVDIRVGYCAVVNFADSPVDAVEMLLRATTALHRARDRGDAITSFEQAPVISR